MRTGSPILCLILVTMTVVSCARHPTDQAQGFTPEMKAWVEAWEQRQTVAQPKWAGGQEVLRWPADARTDHLDVWSMERGLLGLERSELEERLGAPQEVLSNESVSGELLLYPGFGLILYQGVCHGWVPRSEAFEEYFVQPDI